jgi:TetR/AcrR family transcriptional regulator, tetracycline repressor protein
MDAATITGAALQALDEVGLDKLTMRTVAGRLGVQAGGLYYYLPDKSALLQAMANEICRQALADFEAGQAPEEGWAQSARRLCDAVRTAVRGHRDGARVLAAGPLNGSLDALALMERLISVLEAGIDLTLAASAADALLSYITGYVLQEQMPPGGAVLTVPLDELRARVPRVLRGAQTNDDEMYRRAVTAIIDGFTRPA